MITYGTDDSEAVEVTLTAADCIDGGEHEGPVEYRAPLSGTGRSFPRCAKHWDKRLDRQAEIDRRYPQQETPPSDFDPTYAGETW